MLPLCHVLGKDAMHIDDNAASEFVSGMLTPSAQSRIEAHLASCRDCRALVAALAMDAGTDSHAATVPQEPNEPSSPSQVAQHRRCPERGSELPKNWPRSTPPYVPRIDVGNSA